MERLINLNIAGNKKVFNSEQQIPVKMKGLEFFDLTYFYYSLIFNDAA